MSVDCYFIIAFVIIISPFLLIFFRTYLLLCKHLFRLCHVPRAATLTTVCSVFAKCAATGGKPRLLHLRFAGDVKEPTHSPKRVGRGVPGVVVWSFLIVLLLINVLGEIANELPKTNTIASLGEIKKIKALFVNRVFLTRYYDVT